MTEAMSDPNEAGAAGASPEDELRQHTEGPSEGEAALDESGSDVPREHAEDPVEG
jgi:hypothetical protein